MPSTPLIAAPFAPPLVGTAASLFFLYLSNNPEKMLLIAELSSSAASLEAMPEALSPRSSLKRRSASGVVAVAPFTLDVDMLLEGPRRSEMELSSLLLLLLARGGRRLLLDWLRRIIVLDLWLLLKLTQASQPRGLEVKLRPGGSRSRLGDTSEDLYAQ